MDNGALRARRRRSHHRAKTVPWPGRVVLLSAVAGLVGCSDDAVRPDESSAPGSPDDSGAEQIPGEGDSPAATRAEEASAPAAVAFSFTEEAAERGLVEVNRCGDAEEKRFLLECVGQGCAVFDYDDDGRMDLYLVDGSRIDVEEGEGGTTGRARMDGRSRLYRNTGDARFEDVTEATASGYAGVGSGAYPADIDGDGDRDLFLTAWGPDVLLRNDAAVDAGGAQRRFTEVTAEAGLADPRWGTGASFLDADRDGDLDLYVANYFSWDPEVDPDAWNKVRCAFYELRAACGPKGMIAEDDAFYVNDGQGRFADETSARGFAAVDPRYGLGVIALDFDVDGDDDVYVANDSRGNFLFENDGEGLFEEIADFIGASLNQRGVPQAGMGLAAGDYDGDGDEDLFVTNFSHDFNTLYRNEGADFVDVTRRMGFSNDDYFALGWGTAFLDLDHDGVLEIFVANGHVYLEADLRKPELSYRQTNRIHVFRDGRLWDVSELAGPALARVESSRGVAVGDLDDDGDLDMVVIDLNAPPALMINGLIGGADDSGVGHFLSVELRGVSDNTDGIGAWVEVEAGGRVQRRQRRCGQSYFSAHDPRLHFGLGDADRVDRLQVRWPSGDVQEWRDLALDGWVTVRQGDAEYRVRTR